MRDDWVHGVDSTPRKILSSAVGDAQAWFDALDRRVIRDHQGRWVASVLGVHADAGDWWIDVARDAEPSANVVLRVPHHATLFHAVSALRRSRPRTGQGGAVVAVAAQA